MRVVLIDRNTLPAVHLNVPSHMTVKPLSRWVQHDTTCKLENGVRVTLGAGSAHGETAEQCFAGLKNISAVVHQMAHTNRIDRITEKALSGNDAWKARMSLLELTALLAAPFKISQLEKRIARHASCLRLREVVDVDTGALLSDWRASEEITGLFNNVKSKLPCGLLEEDGPFVKASMFSSVPPSKQEERRFETVKVIHALEFQCLFLDVDETQKALGAMQCCLSQKT